ncbi:glycosyltransferase family 2 protein [Leeuwenhoekiella sp. NPDC079379]|uniref:glycosyltransferase family 2 protein n=1 Tax=Leeuwenhoekiella sp. NPDC079379 TaxID=3364122 RepID=UPI0037C83FFA
MKESQPLISVLLPVYNAANFIEESVQSILNQTLGDFELLIIDDCSTDSTLKVIESFEDSRIFLYRKKINSGYTESLNWGITNSRGKYIARMDADDISLPTRFEKQIRFLEENPDVAICGTDAKVIGGDLKFNYPSSNEEIKINLLFGSSLVHPTIMGRREVFLEYSYDTSKEPAEDYDLFTRLAVSGKKMANIPESLLVYRVHSNQISQVQNTKQNSSAQQSMLRMFKKIPYDKNTFSDTQVLEAIWPSGQHTTDRLFKSIEFYKCIYHENDFYERAKFQKRIVIKKMNYLKFHLNGNHLKPTERIILYLHFIKISPIRAFKYFLSRIK